jgi:pimeloyl-ACP methyl ester carboxylesterase
LSWSDPFPHVASRVDANGVGLDVLDWGGDGPPLVLIHGIGDDPHLFDDLAAPLSRDFRVVAYARRGHGHSDAPPPGSGDGDRYAAATLVEDLGTLLERLRIARASLLGWSMGGNEITAFAGLHPERVDRLIYLEAAYDWSDPVFQPAFEDMLGRIGPRAPDFASLDALRAWFRASWLGDAPWTDGLESSLRDAARPDAEGRLHPAPTPEVFAALLATLRTWRRDYSRVRAPALAIYSSTEFFPTERTDPALTERLRAFERDFASPFRRRSMERIRLELSDVTIAEIAGRTHMSIGVRGTGSLASLIREFLQTGTRPCGRT